MVRNLLFTGGSLKLFLFAPCFAVQSRFFSVTHYLSIVVFISGTNELAFVNIVSRKTLLLTTSSRRCSGRFTQIATLHPDNSAPGKRRVQGPPRWGRRAGPEILAALTPGSPVTLTSWPLSCRSHCDVQEMHPTLRDCAGAPAAGPASSVPAAAWSGVRDSSRSVYPTTCPSTERRGSRA